MLLKSILGKSFSVEDFITGLETNSLDRLMCDNHILLGYGKEASLAYPSYLVSDAATDLTYILCTAKQRFTLTHPAEGITQCTLHGKAPISPVSFIENPRSLEEIEKIYLSEDLLERCLEQLCS